MPFRGLYNLFKIKISMKINIKTTVAALVLALVLPLHAQAQGAGRAAKPKKKIKWTSMAPKLGDDFFATPEAARIGDNLLFYQHPSGGWPKNLQLHDELTDDMRKRIEKMKHEERYATIDNSATTTEIKYLARLYNATGEKKYLDAVVRGFDYMFEAQYDNGGWPQFYPLSEGYYTHITYNDDAKCAPLWARFYTIEDNRPFFSDRDSVIKFDISEIGYERRNGYKWFNSDGMKVLKRYESWARKYGLDAAK